MTAGRGEPHDARTNPDGTAGPWRRLLMTLPAEDHSVRLARHAAHVVLGAWRLAHMEETAVLIVSELVTNAVRPDALPDAGLDEAGFVGQHHHLDPVGQGELGQDPADVRLHGGLGDEQR